MAVFAISQVNDANVSAVSLTNGNIAVGWSRTNGANTEFWTAVFNSAGGVVSAAHVVDPFGSINANVSLAALGTGYVAVYEDNGWGSGTDITMAQLDNSGNLIDFFNVSDTLDPNDGSLDALPSVTRVVGDLVAISWDDNTFGDTDNITALIDGAAGTLLASRNTLVGDTVVDDVQNSSNAAYSGGQVVVVGDDVTDGVLNIETLAAVRVITAMLWPTPTPQQTISAMTCSVRTENDILTGGALNDRHIRASRQ